MIWGFDPQTGHMRPWLACREQLGSGKPEDRAEVAEEATRGDQVPAGGERTVAVARRGLDGCETVEASPLS